MNGTGFSLKDHLFNVDRVRYLAGLFHSADKSFDAPGFVRETLRELRQLELKARIVHIATKLEAHLATDFRLAARQIVAALPPPLDPTRNDDDFGDFIFAPLGEFVVRNGLAKRHLAISLRTLKAITQRFSMEDAIRSFIQTHTDETLAELGKWSTDGNYHVRRLVSEGTRPRLPWSGRLSIDAATPLPLLDNLYADSTRYVTRSVANHLNDISKTHPRLVLETLGRWKNEGKQKEDELQWMCKHALRTLVKQGSSEALGFLGFTLKPKIHVSNLRFTTDQIRRGESLEFTMTVRALRDESLVIDYIIDYLKSNGTHSPKVHKLKPISLSKGESTTIKKRHLLRANATTYTLYPGSHFLSIQINGQLFGRLSFELL
ncbi:MAG: hypothetical protein O3C60_03600 [Planctomycetota bacterium]|nr:hypothetical protein [Planctomycetota bacterium]